VCLDQNRYRCRNFEVGVLFRSTHGRRYFAARQPQDVLGPPPRSSSSQPSPQKPLANRCRPAVPPDSSTCLEAPQNEDEEDELAEWIALPLPYALTDLTPFDGPRCKQVRRFSFLITFHLLLSCLRIIQFIYVDSPECACTDT